MVQTTLHVTAEQKMRIDRLPRGVSFSMLVRNHFDDILFEYESKGKMVVKAL